MKKTFKSIFEGGPGQLTIPLIAIALLAAFNLIRDPSFFRYCNKKTGPRQYRREVPRCDGAQPRNP